MQPEIVFSQVFSQACKEQTHPHHHHRKTTTAETTTFSTLFRPGATPDPTDDIKFAFSNGGFYDNAIAIESTVGECVVMLNGDGTAGDNFKFESRSCDTQAAFFCVKECTGLVSWRCCCQDVHLLLFCVGFAIFCRYSSSLSVVFPLKEDFTFD
jgi:hypothetical protein